MTVNRKGRPEGGTMAAIVERAIVRRKVDIVSLDPFVKTHGVSENDNNLIDQVTQVLLDLSAKYNIAVDTPHHVRKGPSDPGNADRARGASSQKDAYRLVYTLSTMSPEEAETFGIPEEERHSYVRMDARSTSFRQRGRRNGSKSSASASRMRPNAIPTAMRSKRSNRGRRLQRSTGSTPGLAIASSTRSTPGFRTASGTVQRHARRPVRHGRRSKDTRQGSPNLNAGKSSGSGSQTAF
jgi:AAA domain